MNEQQAFGEIKTINPDDVSPDWKLWFDQELLIETQRRNRRLQVLRHMAEAVKRS